MGGAKAPLFPLFRFPVSMVERYRIDQPAGHMHESARRRQYQLGSSLATGHRRADAMQTLHADHHIHRIPAMAQ